MCLKAGVGDIFMVPLVKNSTIKFQYIVVEAEKTRLLHLLWAPFQALKKICPVTGEFGQSQASAFLLAVLQMKTGKHAPVKACKTLTQWWII